MVDVRIAVAHVEEIASEVVVAYTEVEISPMIAGCFATGSRHAIGT